MKRLPRSLDELKGLRAARWLRESTRGQYDNYGPEAQREQQDRAIERFGLTETGISWSVAHSGRTVSGTPEWGEMLARAGLDYDVLLVGYTSRFSRHLLSTLDAVENNLHPAGVAVLFCDERVLTSNPDQWDAWTNEAREAESYSHKLGRRIREGYEAKFRRFADPGGRAPIGFVRTTERPFVLTVDPETIGYVVHLFEEYATGSVSADELARREGISAEGLKETLRNPIYNGWVKRKGDRQPATWRADPPVSDTLWERVATIRERRTRGGGTKRTDVIDPLAKLVRCVCGSSIRSFGLRPQGHTRYHSQPDCPEAPPQRLWQTETWLAPIEAQVAALKVDDRTMADVVSVLSAPDVTPPSIDRARAERRRREVALDFAASRLTEAQFTEAIAAMAAPVEEPSRRPR
jgi:DNA invertase Pin-like site-specific DNA recombinase